LVEKINGDNPRIRLRTITMSALCSHFERCELAQGNTWRSHSTKKCYAGYLRRWIIPQWGKYELQNIKTIEVESWLRRLPLAKGSCAKIRGVMSVLFNHACRYELFDRNPIQLVRARGETQEDALRPNSGGDQGVGGWSCYSRTHLGVARRLHRLASE